MAQEMLVSVSSGRVYAHIMGIKTTVMGVKLKEVPQLARSLEEIVRRNVDASGIRDHHGKIKRWQSVSIGTKFGYAAVRAVREPSGPDGAGAITNYLQSGHKVRFPSGRAKRYRPDVHVSRTRAFDFYGAAAFEVNQLSEDFARRLEKAIVSAINENQQTDGRVGYTDTALRGA